MSSNERYVRRAPAALVNAGRRSSVPPEETGQRNSYIREKADGAVGLAIDGFLETGDAGVFADVPADVIDRVVRERLLREGASLARALGEHADGAIAQMLEDRFEDELAVAILCSTERPKGAYSAVLIRLALEVRAHLVPEIHQALRVVRTVAPTEVQAAFSALRALTADRSTVQQWRLRGATLLAHMGDGEALGLFVSLLGDGDRTVARAAHSALKVLTCHDLGTMRAPWQRWAQKNGDRRRVDWLVEALADRRAELRHAAMEALTRDTGESFGLQVGQPRSAFIAAQAQFAALLLQR